MTDVHPLDQEDLMSLLALPDSLFNDALVETADGDALPGAPKFTRVHSLDLEPIEHHSQLDAKLGAQAAGQARGGDILPPPAIASMWAAATAAATAAAYASAGTGTGTTTVQTMQVTSTSTSTTTGAGLGRGGRRAKRSNTKKRKAAADPDSDSDDDAAAPLPTFAPPPANEDAAARKRRKREERAARNRASAARSRVKRKKEIAELERRSLRLNSVQRENDLLKTENSALKEQLGFMRRFLSNTPFAAAAGEARGTGALLPVTSPHAGSDAAAGGGGRGRRGRGAAAAGSTSLAMAIVLCVVVAVGTGGAAELAGGVDNGGVAAFAPPAGVQVGGPDAAAGGHPGDAAPNGWHASLPAFVAWSVPVALMRAGAGMATKVATAGGVAHVGEGAVVMWHAACAGAANNAASLGAVAAGFGGLLANHVRTKLARLRKRRRGKLQ